MQGPEESGPRQSVERMSKPQFCGKQNWGFMMA